MPYETCSKACKDFLPWHDTALSLFSADPPPSEPNEEVQGRQEPHMNLDDEAVTRSPAEYKGQQWESFIYQIKQSFPTRKNANTTRGKTLNDLHHAIVRETKN